MRALENLHAKTLHQTDITHTHMSAEAAAKIERLPKSQEEDRRMKCSSFIALRFLSSFASSFFQCVAGWLACLLDDHS